MIVDPTGRLAGRGAYVCGAAACIDRAVKRGPLARALRTEIPAGVGAALSAAADVEADGQDMTAITNTEMIEGGARGQE